MPSKRSPGRSITCRATARQSAALSTPQRSMPVSTSTMIPSVDPAVTAAADCAAAFAASPPATSTRGPPARTAAPPAGPAPQSAAGQVGTLVRLVVRPDGGRAHLLQLARHVVDVALRRVHVEHQGGRDQLIAPLAD